MPRWWADEVEVLMAAKLTPHTGRYAGADSSESLAAVAAKLRRTEIACRSKRMKIEAERRHRAGEQWTTDVPWTAGEDTVICDHMGEPVTPGTWPEVALYLGRTPGAVRTRACNLRRRAMREGES